MYGLFKEERKMTNEENELMSLGDKKFMKLILFVVIAIIISGYLFYNKGFEKGNANTITEVKNATDILKKYYTDYDYPLIWDCAGESVLKTSKKSDIQVALLKNCTFIDVLEDGERR